MATKNKRARSIGLHKRVGLYKRAYAWADKALAYRKAGKFAQAKAAAQKARYWLRKAMALDAQRS
jgi:hypothetical protein